MRDAEQEISHYIEFDYLIVNDDFDVALQNLTAIVTAARHQRKHQVQIHQQLLTELLA
jgi:guanylate kinase